MIILNTLLNFLKKVLSDNDHNSKTLSHLLKGINKLFPLCKDKVIYIFITENILIRWVTSKSCLNKK